MIKTSEVPQTPETVEVPSPTVPNTFQFSITYTGWQCPSCHKIWSPFVRTCENYFCPATQYTGWYSPGWQIIS